MSRSQQNGSVKYNKLLRWEVDSKLCVDFCPESVPQAFLIVLKLGRMLVQIPGGGDDRED